MSRSRVVASSPNIYSDDLRQGRSNLLGRSAAADDSLVRECVDLYNKHYGVWGPGGPRPGKPIQISPARLRGLLDHDEATLCLVRIKEILVGYAVIVRLSIPGKGLVHWVTQLVVDQGYRNIRVATELLFSAWSFTGAYAWGLATANPYAVRVLETTTRRNCRRSEIIRRGPEMCQHLNEIATYIPSGLAVDEGGHPLPIIDSGFFIDHSQLDEMLHNARRAKRPWALDRPLPEGHEWFAAIFGDQPAQDVDGDRLDNLLALGDAVWMEAYARMTLDQQHSWLRHTKAEIDLFMDLVPNASVVLDAGCGNGRHARELAQRGVAVTAIDAVPEMLRRAEAEEHSTLIQYRLDDLRVARGDQDHDAAIVLYDVVGSSTAPGDDRNLLIGVASYVKPGGVLVISVMNAHPLLSGDDPVKRIDDPVDLVAELEQLPPSNSMEATGNVFDPARCLYSTGVFFRKETFTRPGDFLPTEMVIRDKRYQIHELKHLLEDSGWDVQWVLPVRAGRWSQRPPLEARDYRAKELLAYAIRKDDHGV